MPRAQQLLRLETRARLPDSSRPPASTATAADATFTNAVAAAAAAEAIGEEGDHWGGGGPLGRRRAMRRRRKKSRRKFPLRLQTSFTRELSFSDKRTRITCLQRICRKNSELRRSKLQTSYQSRSLLRKRILFVLDFNQW